MDFTDGILLTLLVFDVILIGRLLVRWPVETTKR